MAEKSPKPLVLGFSKTVGVPLPRAGRPRLAMGNPGGRPHLAVAPRVRVDDDGQAPAPLLTRTRSHHASDDFRLEALVREWLLELRMMGRRTRTIEWYRQKMAWYLKTGQAETLGQLTAYELKRYLGELRDRDLADNTIHGFFEVLRGFASWADREGYPVDPALLRVQAPKVAQKEVETYSTEQLERIFAATSPG